MTKKPCIICGQDFDAKEDETTDTTLLGYPVVLVDEVCAECRKKPKPVIEFGDLNQFIEWKIVSR